MEAFSNRIKELTDWRRQPAFPNLHRTTYPEALDGTFHATVKEACTQPDKLKKFPDFLALNKDKIRTLAEQKDIIGMTSFHTAAFYRSKEVCELLLKYGADLNAINNFGYTPLFIALGANQDVALGTWMLERGADPTVRAKFDDKSTWTVFHAASLMKNDQIMILLVRFGANPTSPYADGCVALTYTRSSKSRELISQLSRKYNRRVEMLEAYCNWCGKNPKTLRRCAGCYVVFYCNKECQAFDWKFMHSKNCKKPFECGTGLQEIVRRKELQESEAMDPPHTYLDRATVEQELEAWRCNKKALKKAVGKHFVIAVENGDAFHTLLLYNQDYSIHTKVYHTCSNSAMLRKLLRDCSDSKKGLFLWATPCNPDKGTMYVYPGKPAPHQPWYQPIKTKKRPHSD